MWITNNSEKNLEDGYDGKRYTFVVGQSLEVPTIVARHIFGFGDDDKRPYLIRLGWIYKSDDYDSAVERLNQFSFSSEKPGQPVHSLSPVVDTEPVPMSKRRGAGKVQLVA
jgi:hypothetical protein